MAELNASQLKRLARLFLDGHKSKFLDHTSSSTMIKFSSTYQAFEAELGVINQIVLIIKQNIK